MALFHGDFRGFEHLYDARIRTEDGQEFPVHRILLVMRCDYFRLLNDLPEYQTIFIPRVKSSIMEIILKYIYSGELTFTENNIKDILVAANFLGIEKLLSFSRILAIANLTSVNSVSLFIEGTKDETLGISKAAYRFIEVNFEQIITEQSSRFEELMAESLKQPLSSDSLNVSSEHQVWKAIKRWISKFSEEKKKYLKDLIPCIHFSDTDNELYSEVFGHPYIKESSSYTELIENTRSVVPKNRLPKMVYFFTKSFLSPPDYAEGIKVFITYDENIDIWWNATSKIVCPDVVLHGSGPLVVLLETTENVMYTYNILSQEWSVLNQPNMRRWDYNVVKLGNYFYILGGVALEEEDPQMVDEVVTYLERYNFESESWESLASHEPFIESVATAVDEKIYIVGIQDFLSEFLIAQMYDPHTDIWHTISPPKVYRTLFAMAAYKEQLFVLGGTNNQEYLTSVEVYDPHRDMWSEFENLPFAYILPTVVIINYVMYVYDKYASQIHDFPCPAVFWDETSLGWKVVEASSPLCDLYNYQICAIEDKEVITKLRKENADARWVESPFFIHLNS